MIGKVGIVNRATIRSGMQTNGILEHSIDD